MRKSDSLENQRIFCALAANGSVREAAAQLSMEPTNVFRLVRQLEAELGAVLFARRSSPLRLTDEGRIFYHYAQRQLAARAEMLERIHDGLDGDAGLIEIGSTAAARRFIVVPAVVEYQALHPEVRFQIKDLPRADGDFFAATDGGRNDLVLAFSSTRTLPADAHVVTLNEMPFIACASPDYLRRFGRPASPAECTNHHGLLLKLPGRSSVTHLSKNGRYERLDWKTTSIFESQLDVVEAAALGGGICPDVALHVFVEEFRRGRLEPVMPDWTCPSRECCLYVSAHALKRRRVQRFTDWLAERCRVRFNACMAYYDEALRHMK